LLRRGSLSPDRPTGERLDISDAGNFDASGWLLATGAAAIVRDAALLEVLCDPAVVTAVGQRSLWTVAGTPTPTPGFMSKLVSAVAAFVRGEATAEIGRTAEANVAKAERSKPWPELASVGRLVEVASSPDADARFSSAVGAAFARYDERSIPKRSPTWEWPVLLASICTIASDRGLRVSPSPYLPQRVLRGELGALGRPGLLT
jgi:hypothetical protein